MNNIGHEAIRKAMLAERDRVLGKRKAKRKSILETPFKELPWRYRIFMEPATRFLMLLTDIVRTTRKALLKENAYD